MIVACIFTHWYNSLILLMLSFCRVCIYSMLYSPTITYILYGRTMRTVQQIITLFAILLLLLLLLLSAIYDYVGYVQRNDNNGLVCWSMMMQVCMSGAMNNVLSDGNHTNDNNTTTSSSSLTDAVAVASPWVRRVYST
mmetsp:Transcript_31161/g.34908  ORF Transcript_31161/g.34908 Transcript_31161/m.34908 type:complete len:138 (-) Transcript_31161:36-449(-)